MQPNPKILGAFVVGFALVGGSYTISSLNRPTTLTPPKADPSVYAVTAPAPERSFIEVADSDQNGIEDWQEEFTPKTPLQIDVEPQSAAVYEIPNTVTDQMSVQLFQSVLRAKGRGNVGPTTEQVVAETTDLLQNTVIRDTIYNNSMITVVENSPETIRTWANSLGSSLSARNVANSEGELVIIDRALKTENPAELEKLEPLIAMYKGLRDDALATPVPRGFEKQHLDLINVYQAMYASLDGLKLAFTDPVVTLLRVKRYQDDATGLAFALQNIYGSLMPHLSAFTQSDPAYVFVAFSPR